MRENFKGIKMINQSPFSKIKVTCFKYGIRGHIKSEFSTLLKKSKVNRNKDKKAKKTYMAWDENVISSSSNEE